MAAGESKAGSYADILVAIVNRLRATVDGCNEATCYLSLDPDTMPSNPGDHVYVVAPVSGHFREGSFVGGGLNFLTVHSGCIVKIHCPSLIDQSLRDVVAITDQSLGLIRKASAVLASLSPQESGVAWVPMGPEYAISSPFTPAGYSLHKSEDQAVRAIELTFRFEFDWDTTQQ